MRLRPTGELTALSTPHRGKREAKGRGRERKEMKEKKGKGAFPTSFFTI